MAIGEPAEDSFTGVDAAGAHRPRLAIPAAGSHLYQRLFRILSEGFLRVKPSAAIQICSGLGLSPVRSYSTGRGTGAGGCAIWVCRYSTRALHACGPARAQCAALMPASLHATAEATLDHGRLRSMVFL